MTRRNFTLFFELHSTCTYIYNNHLYLEANKVDLHFPWCWGVWLGPSCPHPRWVLYRQDQRCICPGRVSEWDSGQTLEKAPLMIYSPPKTAKTRSLRVMKDKWAILGFEPCTRCSSQTHHFAHGLFWSNGDLKPAPTPLPVLNVVSNIEGYSYHTARHKRELYYIKYSKGKWRQYYFSQ